jgi:hypothetical protein
MMKTLLSLFLIGTIFIIQYKGYYFDPCDGDMCLAIEGHDVAAETFFCDDVECVESILNKQGVEHLLGVFRLNYGFPINKQEASLMEVDIVHKITIDP